MTIVDVLQNIWLFTFVFISPSTVFLPLAGLVDACLIPLSSTSLTNLALMSLSSSPLCNWTQAPYSLIFSPSTSPSTHIEHTCSVNLPYSLFIVHLVPFCPPPPHIQKYETGSGRRCGGGRLPPRPLYQHLSANRKASVTRRELIAHNYVKIATSPFIHIYYRATLDNIWLLTINLFLTSFCDIVTIIKSLWPKLTNFRLSSLSSAYFLTEAEEGIGALLSTRRHSAQ